MNKAAIALLVLGLIQITGELLTGLGVEPIGTTVKAIGAASTASPAPEVFTTHRNLETFSTRFTIEWDARDGSRRSVELTPELYRQIRGPYNRRNVYGAVLSYGPVPRTNERTQRMFEAVSRYAVTGNAPLLQELGIDPSQIVVPVRVRYDVRPGTKEHDWPQVIEVYPE